ncbi:MAG: hypothetical protein ABSE49_21450 [Polyangiaceae bacterium]|jgi:hypothetical protein
MNALEVSIDGIIVGVYVPPEGGTFAAMVGNIPRHYMRSQITTGNDTESWSWQLPDIQAGQTITFRLVEAPVGSGVPPQFVRRRDLDAVEKTNQLAKEAAAEARHRNRGSGAGKP